MRISSNVSVAGFPLAPYRFIGKVTFLALLLCAAAYAAMTTSGLTRLAAELLIGVLLVHATELVHQCLHQTGTGVGRADRFLGAILAALACLSFNHYRYWHLYHHAHNGSEEDRESFGYAYPLMMSRNRLMRLAGVALHLSMVFYFIQTLQRLALAAVGKLAPRLIGATPAVPPKPAYAIQRDYQLIGIGLFIAVLGSVVFGADTIVRLWLIPLCFWAPIHALIELPEHFLCDHPDELERHNTRSIRAGAFMQWYTNGNCFHVGHHDNMRVPMHRLEEYEREMRRISPFKYDEASYGSFYLSFAWYILSGKWRYIGRAPVNQAQQDVTEPQLNVLVGAMRKAAYRGEASSAAKAESPTSQ